MGSGENPFAVTTGQPATLRPRKKYESVIIVEHVVHEANLAWAVAEAAKPYLNAVERNAVFVAIGAGETFAAIRGLLRSVEIKQIPLGLDLLQQCRMWLRGYGGHDDERHLRRLIEEPLITYVIGAREGSPVYRPCQNRAVGCASPLPRHAADKAVAQMREHHRWFANRPHSSHEDRELHGLNYM